MKELFIPMSAAIAELITHPMDYVKTQKQNYKKTISTTDIIKNTYKKKGVIGFYPSVVPAIARHLIYTTSRIGIYEKFRNQESSILHKTAITIFASSFGQFIATPADVVKVQLQTNNKNTATIVKDIYRSNGLLGFYNGWKPTVLRAVAVNIGELLTYDTTKHKLLNYMDDGIPCHVLSSINSGFVSTVLSTPADVIKTRIMASNSGNIFSVTKDIIKNEGIASLWKGFFPIWARIAPWQMFFWISYEQLRLMNGYGSFK